MQKTVNIERRNPTVTVSEMRRELARILSHLDGDQEVAFSFVALFPDATTTPFLKRLWNTAVTTKRTLEAPYYFNSNSGPRC